jgi:hypothetical protein
MGGGKGNAPPGGGNGSPPGGGGNGGGAPAAPGTGIPGKGGIGGMPRPPGPGGIKGGAPGAPGGGNGMPGMGNGNGGAPGAPGGGKGMPLGPGMGPRPGAIPPGWFCGSMGLAWAWPSAAYEEVMESMTDWAFSWPISGGVCEYGLLVRR